MAILWDSLVRPDDLTTFMRGVPLNQQYVLNQLLPDKIIQDEEVELRDVTVTQRTAKFRAYDAPPAPGRRDTFTRRMVKLPAIGQFLSSGEVDRRRLAIARARGRSDQDVIAAIYDDAENNVRSIQNRVELARGDVLTDGIIAINENNTVLDADFGVPGGNKVTAGVLWDHTASGVYDAPVLDQLRTWTQTYRTVNGFAPGGLVLSDNLRYLLLANAQIKALYPNQGVAAPLVNLDQVDNALRSYGLPPILFTYDAQVDVDGTTTSVLPANKVLFVPPAGVELGFTAWGLTVTGQEIANQGMVSYQAAAGIVGVIDKNTAPPYRETVYADASVLPVISNPRALMIATVAA